MGWCRSSHSHQFPDRLMEPVIGSVSVHLKVGTSNHSYSSSELSFVVLLLAWWSKLLVAVFCIAAGTGYDQVRGGLCWGLGTCGKDANYQYLKHLVWAPVSIFKTNISTFKATSMGANLYILYHNIHICYNLYSYLNSSVHIRILKSFPS